MRGGPYSYPTRKASRESELLIIADSEPPVATPITPVEKAIGMMIQSDLRRLPIVRIASMSLIGEVPLMSIVDYLGGGARSKIIEIRHRGNYFKALREPVEILMNKEVVSVELHSKLDEALDTMAESGVGTLFIVDRENRIRGVLTERHVLRIIAGLLSDIYVRDIMTPRVVTARPTNTLSEACRIMLTYGFRRLPIVSGKKLVGIFTAMGFLRYIAEKGVYRAIVTGNVNEVLSKPLNEIMKRNVVTIGPNVEINKAAELMLNKGVGCLPVVEDDELVGIVTERDFLMAYAKH